MPQPQGGVVTLAAQRTGLGGVRTAGVAHSPLADQGGTEMRGQRMHARSFRAVGVTLGWIDWHAGRMRRVTRT